MKRFDERLKIPTWIGAIVLAGVLSSCTLAGTPDTSAPSVLQTTPSSVGAAPTNEPVTAPFDEDITPSSLTTSSFALTTGATPVTGSVSFDAATDVATYTATLSTDVTDVAGNPPEDAVTWNFTTDAVAASTESGAGSIGSLTIEPGLHTWSTPVDIDTDLTLAGTATDVWVLQIAQDLTVANGISVLLSGALPENVFWQVAGQTTIGTSSVLNGIGLSKTAVVMNSGGTLTGQAFAQTQITLDAASVTRP